MTLGYAIALAEARSCLAALADTATDFDESIHFEHLLLDLDTMHPDGPALYSLVGDRATLLQRLERAVDRMLELAGDGLSLELLLADASTQLGATGPFRRSVTAGWPGGDFQTDTAAAVQPAATLCDPAVPAPLRLEGG